MPKITSIDELNRLRVELDIRRQREASAGVIHVTVGMGTCGIASGALEVYRVLSEELAASARDVRLGQTGCIGLCDHEPIVEVTVGDRPKVSYGHVNQAIARRIVHEHVGGGRAVDEFVIDVAPFPTL